MFARDFDVETDSERLRATVDLPSELERPRILALHGAGTSDRTRIRYISAFLAQSGWGTLRFDFSGHGDSSGTINGSSLEKRAREATLVARHLDPDRTCALIGTSMGAHLAARLSQGLRPSHLFLICPAAYGQAAENTPFGPSFTEIIRRPNSYVDSLAFEAIAQYTGRLTLLIGDNDEVIPPEVIHLYMRSAQRARSVRLERLPHVSHLVHSWAASNPDGRRMILSVLEEELSR